MRSKSSHILSYLFVLFLAFSLAGCFGSTGTSTNGDDGDGGGGGGLFSETLATMITASWSGGAAGPPNDRTDVEATDWDGSMCPASSVGLDNWGGTHAGLTITNNCSLTVTYIACAVSDESGVYNGLNQCASPDPVDTPFVDFISFPLGSGLEDSVNASQNLSVVIFFCSDSQDICGPPLCDQVGCFRVN